MAVMFQHAPIGYELSNDDEISDADVNGYALALPSRFRPVSRSPGDPPNHGRVWDENDDSYLREEFRQGLSIPALAKKLGRTTVSISCRLDKLGLDPDNRELTLTKKEPMMQDFQHLIALLQKGYTTVNVRFDTGGPLYTYKVSKTIAATLAKDGLVVVPAQNAFKVVKVVEVHDEPQIDVHKPLALKWVVQKVDTTAYDDQTAREAEAIQKLQVAERAQAQAKALEVLMGSVEDRAALLALIEAR